MKHIILFSLISYWPLSSSAQQYVNPDTIYQAGDIILQNTDVYYCPFAPPGPMDTREGLCAESDQLLDPNGVGNTWRLYLPVVYDTMTHAFDTLMNWHPCGSGNVLGPNVVWQRLFTARNKPDGTPSDIIVGSNVVTPDTIISLGLDGGYFADTEIINPSGPVIISKNEDVDFRASGTIKLEAGVHGMPGAFFHAYIEPKFDSIVFSDEFDSTAIDRAKWYIANSYNDDYPPFNECSKDTDVRIYRDTGLNPAHDGYALDIMLREDTVDICSCGLVNYHTNDNCTEIADTTSAYLHKTYFYSAIVRACPFPDSLASVPLKPAYQHAPYGKYEIRDKVPHILHNTNNWGTGEGNMEWDLGETNGATMGAVWPGWGHQRVYGPCTGYFVKQATDTLFISSDAGWCLQNQPTELIIDNFIYPVTPYNSARMKDTVVATGRTILQGGFPSSLVNSTGSFTFYYMHSPQAISDTVTWTVSPAADGRWRIFSAPYDTTGGTPQLFSKIYQPTQLTLTKRFDSISREYIDSTFACHWVDSANDPTNYGKIYLDNPMDSADIHTFTEAYQYKIPDAYVSSYGYPVAPVRIDRDSNANDEEGIDSTPYRYHTFAMEYLPHEVRFLIDSVVVRRWPDHLIPPGNPYYDWVTTEPRALLTIHPGEFDMDNSSADPFGNNDTSYYWDGYLFYNTITYEERHYFETHPYNPGCWDVNGQHAAHHLIDYVKVWDVPKDVKIPNFPN